MNFEETSLPYYSQFIHLSRYSRWLPDQGRRETYSETVERFINFWRDKFPKIKASFFDELKEAILHLDNMPSMRTIMSAGEALERDNVSGYNCAFTSIAGRGNELSIYTDEMKELNFEEPIKLHLKNPVTFDEIFYVLLCGTGVGYSVERQYITSLPTIGKLLDRSIYRRTNKNYPGVPTNELSKFDRKTNKIHVADSKYGWASALRILIVELYNANFNIKWDTSKIRPAGSILKTFGGRASGPESLEALFAFCVKCFINANGRKLTSYEAHSIVCKIADIVVVGGVRRSALLSLSNLSDQRIGLAKSGQWWLENPHFALANNSVAYTEKPDVTLWLKEWLALVESRSGERGIFNREAAKKQVEKIGRRDPNYEWGCNPCSEVILRDMEFCNLSEVVVRYSDTFETIKHKVKIATILGTLQATLTDFKYINPEWKKNCEEERLLGVSLTGIMDHPVLNNKHTYNGIVVGDDWKPFRDWPVLPLADILQELKQVAIDTNKEWSERLGINPAVAITCVKPSGTVSQLVDSSSGIHPRWSKYYLRAVRNDIKDPITQFLIDVGFYHEQDINNPFNMVFYFPIKSPDNSVIRDDISAIDQLNLWKVYQDHWCEHKPSCTIYVKEEEWLDVGAWVYKNFDDISGLSFLPWDNGSYQQAPYQELTEEEYYKWLSKMPKEVDWTLLQNYEKEDNTISMQEFACKGGACEI